MKNLKILILVALALFAALCPAPILDERPNMPLEKPVLSEEQREAQQLREQRQMGEVGTITEDTDKVQVAAPKEDSDAAQIIANTAGIVVDPETGATTRPSTRGIVWWKVGLVGIFLAGCAGALKVWVDRKLPMPASGTKNRVL